MGAIFRSIPTEVPTLDHLNMPPVVKELTNLPRGLVLVTGPTGSGKSTTLAAMINEINRTRRCHIVTIEDPIEFLHRHQKSEINQREVGADTESFTAALRHVLRQDPDVILIGEMRDLETISAAITAAETGHLVFATLHTTDAAQTIDRIIDVFPPDQQEQIRNQLSTVLEAILSQTLMPKLDGRGRCCAQEILIATSAVRNLIREGKIHQMASVLQAGSKVGMQTLDQALRALVTEGKVALEEAASKSSTPEDFRRLVAAP
jgi:twitching motility protein PilT